MGPEEIFSQLGLLMVNFFLQPYTFASNLSYFPLCGSNFDPDPQYC